MPTFAQEQNTVDPEVRQQIEAVLMKLGEAYNKHDAAAITALYTQNAVQVWDWENVGPFYGRKPSRKIMQATSRRVPANSSTSLFG